MTPSRAVRSPHSNTASLVATEGGTSEQLEFTWLQMLGRHLFQGRRIPVPDRPPQLRIHDPGRFEGHIRSGTLGALSYCHLDVAPHAFVDDCPPPGPPHHMVVLQLSGTSTFTGEARPVRLRPGDMLLLHNAGRIRVENETRVEQIALLDPFATDDARRFSSHELHRCAGQGYLERMVFRWVGEACGDRGWDGCGISHDVAQMLSRLLGQVLSDSDHPAAAEQTPALTRERIEDYIAHRLEDPELSPASIAEAFGFSVRTLHRAFARAGKESLERHLWQMRIKACAQALRRSEAAASATTLTELALRYGFKSPTHFSGLFRQLHGVTPSAYRRLHHMG